jgi:endonuclease V-like protein UPF0215 family
MESIITLGGEFATSTLAYIGQLFTDLQSFIIILVGLPLAFWAVSKVISLFRKR